MAEYIELEAAIAALTEFCYDQTVSKYLSVENCLVARDAIERSTKVLESLPAADVEPVKRGRWIEAAGGRTICNQCGEYPLYDYFGRLRLSTACPNCGARMDEEVTHER